jgi:hypothetical protein
MLTGDSPAVRKHWPARYRVLSRARSAATSAPCVLVSRVSIAPWRRTIARQHPRAQPEGKQWGNPPVVRPSVCYKYRVVDDWGYSSVGRAARSHRAGQGFESPYLHCKAVEKRSQSIVFFGRSIIFRQSAEAPSGATSFERARRAHLPGRTGIGDGIRDTAASQADDDAYYPAYMARCA